MVDEILSPKARMADPGGPKKAMPLAVRANESGSLGFSDAWPHPAHTPW